MDTQFEDGPFTRLYVMSPLLLDQFNRAAQRGDAFDDIVADLSARFEREYEPLREALAQKRFVLDAQPHNALYMFFFCNASAH